MHPTHLKPSSSSHSRTDTAGPDSDPRVAHPTVTGHDQEILSAAKQSLPPFSITSPRTEAPKDALLDNTVIRDDKKSQGSEYNAPNPPPHREQPSKEAAVVRRQENTTSPMSSASAHRMPTPQLTFTTVTSPAEERVLKGEEDEEEELSASPSEIDDESTVERPPQTAAERLAEKRKMKRFRLTHSQTRFLMNEFSRQPHPDTAQRERLSRDIPGLSSRQVQVWFQNRQGRRAKMKRLTADDQERMMRSRALPATFEPPRPPQTTGGEQSQPPSALAHFSGSSTNFAGGRQIGGPINQSDRPDVPPINMPLVYRNPPYSLSSAGGSSNASESTSLSSDLTYSADRSPMFPGSQTASPFLSGDSAQRNIVPPDANLSSPGAFRARSGSLMSLQSISPLSGDSPLAFPRERVSMENMRVLYQSQYGGSNQQYPSLDPRLGSMAEFSLGSQSLYPTPDYASNVTLLRRNSSGMVPEARAEESFNGAEWLNLSPHEQIPDRQFNPQPHHVRRRQTQPAQSTQQLQPSNADFSSPAIQLQHPFKSPTFPRARQPSLMHPVTSYATTAILHAEIQQQARHSSFEASPTYWPPTVSEYLSPTETYPPQPQPQQGQQQHHHHHHQSQNFDAFDPAASQAGMQWSGEEHTIPDWTQERSKS